MGEFERRVYGEVPPLEPKPMSDGLHVNRAVALGGRMTRQYAWDLAAGGGGRDYVARALLARGLDPEVVKALVVEVFEARKADYLARGRRWLVAGALLVLGAALFGVVTWRVYSGAGYEDVEVAALVVRRIALPAVFGVGSFLWGFGLARKSAKL